MCALFFVGAIGSVEKTNMLFSSSCLLPCTINCDNDWYAWNIIIGQMLMSYILDYSTGITILG